MKYPFKELESLFEPLNIYPFYYFMPFLFISDLHDKGQYIERIRYVGIISTLIARRAILTDLFVDEQYEQLISRNMGGLKKEYLGYYLQIIDVEINNIASKIFIEPSSFYALYNRRFNEYVNTMLMEKDISPLIGMDEKAFKKYAVGKSILHLLVSDMVLYIIKKQELTHQFDNMMKSFIMYLTLQDDVLDIMEDIQKQQPSHFYPWISDGKIIESIDENVEKAVLLKFYLGGGIERCEDLIDKYVEDIITAVKK
ncbi:class 1 isoprenoid biosynthesis enzyme [Escherichia coli]|uniref:class 1 isoprenoid biosynthesis enzyme n=3 Tax=Escherichia coli TaxID=562 RepID=UPI0020281810|nr:class 1 isoprenoid biosynthesis enzyme [Escherichia coli]